MSRALSYEREVAPKNFSDLAKFVLSKQPAKIKRGTFAKISLFFFVNVLVALTVVILSKGALIKFVPFLFLASVLFPFIRLFFSRWLAIRSHGIKMILPSKFETEEEKTLYELVFSLSQKANMKNPPQVGIYEDDELNAFATGRSRKKSLVAFSSGLLENLDEREIAAVAAHEVAHIANGDMVALTMVQSSVNFVVNVVTLPILLWKWLFSLYSDDKGQVLYWIVSTIYLLATLVLNLLGSLVVKAYSRKREYKADNLASRLLDRDSMISALESLRDLPAIKNKKRESYAAFKINSFKSFLTIFSTHPSIQSRIKALQKAKI